MVEARGRGWCCVVVVLLMARNAFGQSDPPREPDTALGAETERLASLRADDASSTPLPANVAAAADLGGTALPAGLDREFASRVQMPSLNIRITPRIVQALARIHVDPHARRLVASWMRHGERYRARIETILASEHVPVELVWVVAAESGFDPNDVSVAGATGLWQLMPDPARSYGLRVDGWLDERRDPDRATHAAAQFLRDLHTRFGTWELALAAYNMGYNALLRAIRKYDSNDFDVLASLEAGLPFETTQYVPRILAGAIAIHNAPVFGFTDVAYDAVASWSDVPLTESVPIDAIARVVHVAPDALRALNPSLLRSRTPPADDAHPFILHVPHDEHDAARSAIAQLAVPPVRLVRMRHGEALDEMAARYGTTAADVLTLSGLGPDATVCAGTELLVPDRDPVDVPPATRPLVPVDGAVTATEGRRRVFYRVGLGDRVDAVARALGVSVGALMSLNHLDDRALLQPGMWLQALVLGSPPDARVWEERDVQCVPRGSEEFYDRAVDQEGRVRTHVVVAQGDTMASIAARYGVSVGTLARINGRSRGSTLAPGESLVVYVNRSTNAETGAAALSHGRPATTDASPDTHGDESSPAAAAHVTEGTSTHATAATMSTADAAATHAP